MGMYTVLSNGQEIKFSGMLAEAYSKVPYPEIHGGVVALNREMIVTILSVMVELYKQGVVLRNDEKLLGQLIYRNAMNAHVLAVLFEWLLDENNEEIVFA